MMNFLIHVTSVTTGDKIVKNKLNIVQCDRAKQKEMSIERNGNFIIHSNIWQ